MSVFLAESVGNKLCERFNRDRRILAGGLDDDVDRRARRPNIIKAIGKDAAIAVDTLAKLVGDGFGEEDDKPRCYIKKSLYMRCGHRPPCYRHAEPNPRSRL